MARTGFDVNAYWMRRGKSYVDEGRLFTDRFRQQEQFVLDTLVTSNVPMGKVLELGCGFGRITRRLAETFPDARITAVDLSPDQLQNAEVYCADHAARIAFLQYDIYSGLPLPGDAYDTAIAVEVFMHHPRNAVRRTVNRLGAISTYVVNHDWSEAGAASMPKDGCWNHDYKALYESLGLECRVFVEPLDDGQRQQCFFVASRQGDPLTA
jgi:SAM-dependent methyltransferase